VTQWEPFCAIGDVVEFVDDGTATSSSGTSSERVEKGATYRAVGLVGGGWDLECVAGSGPQELRLLNSEMAKRVRIVVAAAQTR
jgi:hypothetical protein